MGRDSNLTLICIGTSINRGFGCDVGNVESLGSRSPINAIGSLIHRVNKRLPLHPQFGASDARRRLALDQISDDLRYGLLRDTKVHDE